jgi:hypothetical protein
MSPVKMARIAYFAFYFITALHFLNLKEFFKKLENKDAA